MAMSPVNLIGMTNGTFKFLKGCYKETAGVGSLIHGWCEDCGTRIYQGPKDAKFRAFYPINFHIENGKNCVIPKYCNNLVHADSIVQRISTYKISAKDYNPLMKLIGLLVKTADQFSFRS